MTREEIAIVLSTAPTSKIVDTLFHLQNYLNQCIVDDEYRWITRECLHNDLKQLGI